MKKISLLMTVIFSFIFIISLFNINIKADINSNASKNNSEINTSVYPEASIANKNVEAVNFNEKFASLSGAKNCWGQGKNVDEKNRPLEALSSKNKYGKYDSLFIGEDNNKVYLTFDSGYENGYTSKILDTLKQKNVKAVFFVTYDYVNKNPDLVKRIIGEGHILGNHTYNHPSMPDISLEKASEEIQKLHNYVYENFSYTMDLFRPPRGEYSEKTLALTQSLGYKTMFWSFAYKDWQEKNDLGPAKSLDKIVKGLHSGAIYLLHSVSSDNASILADFIDTARSKGFEFDLYN